jgi:hypothetical protein
MQIKKSPMAGTEAGVSASRIYRISPLQFASKLSLSGWYQAIKKCFLLLKIILAINTNTNIPFTIYQMKMGYFIARRK